MKNKITLVILLFVIIFIGCTPNDDNRNKEKDSNFTFYKTVTHDTIDKIKAEQTKTVDIYPNRIQIKKGARDTLLFGFKNWGNETLRFIIDSIQVKELGGSDFKCGNGGTRNGQLQVKYVKRAFYVMYNDTIVYPMNLEVVASANVPFKCFYEINICSFKPSNYDILSDNIDNIQCNKEVHKIDTINLTVDVTA